MEPGRGKSVFRLLVLDTFVEAPLSALTGSCLLHTASKSELLVFTLLMILHAICLVCLRLVFNVFFINIQEENLLPISHHSVFHGRFSNPQQWRVYSGDVSLVKMSYGKTVQKIISHDKYNRETSDNDIALLKLDTPLTFTSKYIKKKKIICHHIG